MKSITICRTSLLKTRINESDECRRMPWVQMGGIFWPGCLERIFQFNLTLCPSRKEEVYRSLGRRDTLVTSCRQGEPILYECGTKHFYIKLREDPEDPQHTHMVQPCRTGLDSRRVMWSESWCEMWYCLFDMKYRVGFSIPGIYIWVICSIIVSTNGYPLSRQLYFIW